ncbi:MAG: hypothetical protein M3294_03600 [Pseudomonadota bacterium]|nr:hypothetical protein [Pseudomonadota bacterium]
MLRDKLSGAVNLVDADLFYERKDDDVYCASDASEALLSGPDYAKAFGEMDDTVCGGGADKVNLAPDA